VDIAVTLSTPGPATMHWRWTYGSGTKGPIHTFSATGPRTVDEHTTVHVTQDSTVKVAFERIDPDPGVAQQWSVPINCAGIGQVSRA
jgi:hypothetical protein